MIYKVIEVIINNTKFVKYYTYDTNYLKTPLNYEPCEGEKIKIINPPLSNYDYGNPEELSKIIKILNDDIEIYNAYSPLYTDPCYPLSILNKYDLILNDRREYINKKNITLCEKGCEYEGDNINRFNFICYCPIKMNMDEKPSIITFLKDNKNYIKNHNFYVLKCYKLNFSFEGQEYNLFSEIFLFLFIINICLIIKTEMFLNNNLNNLIIYCEDFIDKNNKNIQFEQLRNSDPNIFENFQKFYNDKILNIPPKKYQKYQNYLIYVYPKKIRNKFLIEEELNNLNYKYYRHFENRENYKIFLSIFKFNYDFSNTFLIYNNTNKYKEYKFFSIKLMIYINSLIVSIIINLIFYSDETMHKIYIENEEYKYNIIFRLPIIFISNFIYKFIIILFDTIINFQDDFIKLKRNLAKEKKEQAITIKKSFKRNRYIFFMQLLS